MTVKLLSKQQLSLINKDTLRYRLAEAEKDYFLTLILNCIYSSHLKDKLIFKGGTALYHKELVSDTDIEKMIKKLSFSPIIKK